MTHKISAVIITKNEELNIQSCLASLDWVDEIIIVDNGSTDKTIQIAQTFNNVRIYIHKEWQGFGYQKSLALKYTSNDWILSLDADEVIVRELGIKIQEVIQKPIHALSDSIYTLYRLNYFCAAPVKYSGWQNDKILRLFNKKFAKFSNDKVHEKVINIDDSIFDLHNVKCISNIHKLHHFSYTSLEQVLQKINHYSSLGALQLQQKGKKSSYAKAIIHGLTAFIKSFIIKKGFLDGIVGFNIALMNGLASYYKYAKLNLLNKY